MMDPSSQNDIYSSTVKCSSCAFDIPLAAIAEHDCRSIDTVGKVDSPYHREAGGRGHESSSHTHQIYSPQYGHDTTAPSMSKTSRPVLPKLDSSMTGRSGLRPSEAASIAYDLGLPSPVGASGSGRRSPHPSRSRSRKASAPRPPSPEGPISQDCAFPPFPVKPKRSTHEKDLHIQKSNSVSRSTASAKKPQHSSNYSTSSSIYSSVSGFGKRRTSNTSSSQRSRQGTIDDSMSWPSTAPSSPRQSALNASSREQSIDQTQQVPSLISSNSSTPSEPNSSSSMLPPTPLWLNDIGESPRIVQSPNSELGWTPTEHSIPEEQIHEIDVSENDGVARNEETFDKILSSQQTRTSIDMFDNPPKDPLYKTKRPAALLQIPQHTANDPAMPLSARAPPPPATNSSLTRTLTNLFGRKRSQTSGSKGRPLPSFDSPRMRALAPDPPERPQRGEDLWRSTDAADTPSHTLPPSQSMHQAPSPFVLGDGPTPTTANPAEHDQHKPSADTMPDETPAFEFDFNNQNAIGPATFGEAQRMEGDSNSRSMPSSGREVADTDRIEEDLRRVSIDSASSYGSIGFSHQSKSSRSTLPVSSENGRKVSALSEPDQYQAAVDNVELAVPARLYLDELIPDSPTDPCYHGGKLSPVSDAGRTKESPRVELPVAPPDTLSPDTQTQEVLRATRPVTPAGVKGRCRGCSDLIMTGQKSVASADGRLSGRYHKDCFVCQSCKSPFATADFYVFNDQPYCGHHYHMLNDTLCTGCGKGIEGQYAETFDAAGNGSKKFHPRCLQCTTCKVQLNEDYFEFHGRVYCERDAFRAASGPRNPYDTMPSRPSPLVREYISSGEPGLKGRFPERRTTRLIMT